MIRRPTSSHRISDLNGPSGNPPDDGGDPPCELLNSDQITADICNECNINETCGHRVEETCSECDGDGYVIVSCCGDDIKGRDVDLCPTCHEHTGGEDDQEPCDNCDGTGVIK